MSHNDSHKKHLMEGSLAAIMMVLLMGGAFFGVIPAASAANNNDNDNNDENDDNNDEEHLDTDKKCKKHRYDNKCDREKPKVNITDPSKKEKQTASQLLVVIDATDATSGIKKVELRINGGPLIPVVTKLDSNTWKYSADCADGTTKKMHVTVKATDWAGNMKRDHVNFALKCI